MSVKHGSDVGVDFDINPPDNVINGDYSSIGARSTIWSIRTKVIILKLYYIEFADYYYCWRSCY